MELKCSAVFGIKRQDDLAAEAVLRNEILHMQPLNWATWLARLKSLVSSWGAKKKKGCIFASPEQGSCYAIALPNLACLSSVFLP